MATASPSPLASSVEKTNGAKLSRLLIDGGTTVLRNVFDSYHPPANLAADLSANRPTLNFLFKKKRVLHQPQWDLLFPPGGVTPDSKTFDITLLFLLLTNICGLAPPPSGWQKPPPSSDTSLEANLARIKLYRNELYGHVTSTGIPTAVFNVKWQEISAVLVALGLNLTDVVNLKSAPCGEDYISAVIEWAKSDEEIKSQLREVCETQKEARQMQEEDHRTLQDTHKGVEEALKTQREDHETLQQVKETVENLKERRSEEQDETLRKLAKINTQNVIEYHAERYQEGTRQSFFKRVENWLDDRSSSNRVLVISGNAGMGKSVISAIVCKRMQEAGRLSGSHFCQHNKARYRNAKVMLQSLACQLSDSVSEYKNALVKTLSRNLGVELNDMEVKDLFELLFEEPLMKLKEPGRNILIVIDGLDESEYQGRNELLDVIANHFTKLPCWIRFLVTTRSEINIAESLRSFKPLQLEPEDEENLMDIRLLFKKRLSDVIQHDLQEVILTELVKKSEGLILYAYLLSDFIKENVSLLTPEHLDSALPSGISSVYLRYFQRLETELCKELKIKEEQVLTFLSALTAAREPLQLGFVYEMILSGTRSLADRRKVMKAIACISALLPVRDDSIHFFHKSVKDWLTDSSSYGQHDFTVDEKDGHGILSRLCTVELDDVRRKGVHDVTFSATTKYALQHGVGHVLELEDDTRGCSLEEVVKKYVIDVEVVYAKLCVNSTTAAEDIVRLQKLEISPVLSDGSDLNILLFLLRKYHNTFAKRPGIFFQTVLNEGETTLAAEASKLLQDKYPEIAYMEYILKETREDAAQALFRCSSSVTCFDVSPELDYMVCECKDGTIHLWSLHTGKLEWVRPGIVEKRYSQENKTYRTSPSSSVFSCYRSVVFHPTKEVVLPGILSLAYSIDGDLNPLFPESDCSFTVCSIVNSGEKTTMLTNCRDDPKCIILWSLENGSEITRNTRDEDVLSFACSRDGRMLAISHSTGSVCLVDATEGFRTLAQATTSKVCGMIKFSSDNRFLFCWHEPCSQQDHYVFQLRVTRCSDGAFSLDVLGDKVSYKPLEHESRTEPGFLSGDPFSCLFEKVQSGYAIPAHISVFVEGAFVFILSEQCVLRTFPENSSIAVFAPTELRSHTPSFHRHQKFIASDIEFSRNGEILYVVATERTDSDALRQKSVDKTVLVICAKSGCLVTEKRIQRGKSKRLVPLNGGVLFTSRNDFPELWNLMLSERIRSWPNIREITDMMLISEERVACVGQGNEVTILDVTSTDIVATIPFSHEGYESQFPMMGREAITCNSKFQLLSTDRHSVQLSDSTGILWKKPWHDSLLFCYNLPGMFSPTEEFVVISAKTPEGDQGAYLLDAWSGKTCRMLCRGTYFFDCNFVSDEECVIDYQDASGEYCFQLFNIKSGDLLGLIVRQFKTSCLATCPPKRLVAIDVVANDDSKNIFQIIQVKRPRNKDKRKSKGKIKKP